MSKLVDASIVSPDTTYKSLVIENEKLKKALEIAKEKLGFYANQDNWTIDRDATDEANEDYIDAAFAAYGSIIDDRESGGVSLGKCTNSIGGKRARQALKEIEEVLSDKES